ncbi:alpha/beta-hydrolase [Neolentinus lepideus HHB14362 ss-1]|uniref:Alpha/beta-hydrolase n=1 Tax=Neolentinus lepideus HHB14362 ss-1 TaxID=1314782 RepID=A0A165P5U1_9AGAM|nr:alpha/beta-hydrolase [Neolentinus lepideus HHB14362 ss-1]
MLQEEVVYTPVSPSYRFKLAAKRYWLREAEAYTRDPEALTLILLHSTSFHKETWEPTLEKLFSLLVAQKRVKVREAWTIDCPNHGVAAALNQKLFQEPENRSKFSCEKYAQAAYEFLTAGPVDFRSRNLVGIGHSLGGVAMSFLQCMVKPAFDFRSVILIEPMLSPDGKQHLAELRERLVRGARTRRAFWQTKEQALAYYQRAMKRKDRGAWHPNVVKLFVKYGLRPCEGGYTLACTREEEVGMYEDNEGSTKPVKYLDKACKQLPIHLILGGINDFIPRPVQDALTRPSSERTFASQRIIPDVGHLIPQEAPEELARHIFETLITYPPEPQRTNSRL